MEDLARGTRGPTQRPGGATGWLRLRLTEASTRAAVPIKDSPPPGLDHYGHLRGAIEQPQKDESYADTHLAVLDV